MKWVCIVVALSLQLIASAHATQLRIPDSSIADKLPIDLLKEFVARSDRFDTIVYPYGEAGDVSFSKTRADLNNDVLDLLWTATSIQYEKEMRAVYIPIYRGLLGMRIGIVETDKQALFRTVSTFEQFKQYIPCQGKLWADTEVLEANDILVAKSIKYTNLFDMLEGDRCDYFPRAVFEPWGEIKRMSHLDLAVDDRILLRYTMPMFFFVKNEDRELADHMTRILTEMMADGTFERLFFADDDVKNSLAQARLSNRRLFDLKNPYVSQAVEAIEKKYWYDPLQEQKR